MASSKLKWIQKQKYTKDFKLVKAGNWDDLKDFIFDKGSYVLIRVYKKTKEIGVGICNYNHEILIEFRGKRSQDIYQTIFDYCKRYNKKWFTRLDHAAYLGKELKKAEMCLALGIEYTQE